MRCKHSVVLSCSLLVVACSEPLSPADEAQEIVENLVQAGYPANDIQIFDGRVYIGHDGHVTLEASREMLEPVEAGPEHYRTTNLVSGKTKICLNPTSTFNSYSRLSAGLDLAIGNYNALPLVFDFVRGSSGCNAVISVSTTSGTGGHSGFPSGGNPYGQILIGTALQSYSTDVNEHVISHNIGHTIGMRHSDYYNTAISCGSGGNEGTGPGAIHIPGTPTTAYVGGSLFNTCFRTNETGEFTSSDVTALNAVY